MVRACFITGMILFIFTGPCHRDEGLRTAEPTRDSLHAPIKKLTPGDSLLLALDSLKKDTALLHASLAWSILDYSTGRAIPLASCNEELSLVPASVIKILTTGAALEILGERTAFRTLLQYDGSIEEHTLKGNLYIRGGGDPTFGSEETLDRWGKKNGAFADQQA